MESPAINISTARNVLINYQIAGLGERIIAVILDILIKMGYLFFLSIVFGRLDGFRWIIIIGSLPLLFYGLVFELAMNGQTPGKRIRKIRVVMADGSQAKLGAYLIRWLFSILDTPFFAFGAIDIVSMAVTDKCQRIGDILAQTVVINVRDRVSLKETLYEKLNSDYKPKYEEVKKLDSNDIELIKKVLNTPEYRNNFEMVYNLTNKIQAKMGALRYDGPEEFLEIVVKDYNFLCDE